MRTYSKTDQVLVDLVISQIKKTAFVGAILMTLVAVVLWPVFGAVKVGSWILAGFLLNALRVHITYRIENGTLLSDNYLWRERTAAIGFAAAGAHWGMAGWLFLDPDNVNIYAFVSGAVLGVASASIASASPRPKLWLAFSGSEFAIVAAKLISLGYIPLAVMTVVFILGLFFVAVSVGKRIESSVTKDFLNEELLKEVSIARDMAEKANIEKSLFMAATSHDLRQPLHAQGLLLEAMKGKNTPDRKLVDKLVASNAVLRGLFDSLLEISQLDSGTIKVNESHQPVYDICRQVINEFEFLAIDKKLALKLTGEQCIVLTDPILLGRVLRNLVSNGIKYTNAGNVTINVSSSNDQVVLSVTDTGVGIAAEKHEVIFNEYTQLNNDTRDRQKGVGLGLALVRRMCTLLEYEVRVNSALAEGASFTLLLPQGDASKVFTAEETLSPVPVENLNIVLVDDEQAILEAMQTLLSQWKCSCHAFSSVEEAAKFIARGDFSVDIIISDYRLGDDVTGMECIQRLRELTNAQTPAVLISGDTDPNLLKELQDGGFYMLHKPLKPSELRNLMSILLSASAPAQELCL